MTTALMPIEALDVSTVSHDRALSQDAENLRAFVRSFGVHQSSVILGRRRWNLDAACLEALGDNWDGYGAQPVTQLSYRMARSFLDALPLASPEPDIAVDPDGEVSFTWYRGPSEVFSVSVADGGRVSYAGLFGSNTSHGTEYFYDELPEAIRANLTRLFPAWT